MKAPWAFAVGGRAPEDGALLAYLREAVVELEERFDVEVEWATMSGVDLLRDRNWAEP